MRQPDLILDLPDPHSIRGAGLLDATEINRRTGSNSGNFAFRYALIERFFPESALGTFASLNNASPQLVVAVACANWIGLSPQHEATCSERFQTLTTTSASVVPFGLGCQMPAGTTFAMLGSGTRKFLLRLCELAPSISVRDTQTAELLRSVGYSRVSVTGCPSHLINPSPTLGRLLLDRTQSLLARRVGWAELALTMTEYTGGYPFSADMFAWHYRMMRDHGSCYVGQDLPLLPILLRQSNDLPLEYSRIHFPGLASSDEEMLLVLRRHAVYFTSYDAWLMHMKKFDLCLGMRLHGNITATQAGVPSLVIAHDDRTVESCKTLGMPWMAVDAFLEMDHRTPAGILERIADALRSFDASRAVLAGEMREHLKRSGLATPVWLQQF